MSSDLLVVSSFRNRFQAETKHLPPSLRRLSLPVRTKEQLGFIQEIQTVRMLKKRCVKGSLVALTQNKIRTRMFSCDTTSHNLEVVFSSTFSCSEF